MKTETFINILENKTQIQQLETVELKAIVDKFPYFQAARVLYLKGLKNQDSFKYNNELKITAAYTQDRTVLFNYITTASFNDKKTAIHQQISEKITEEQKSTKNLIEIDEELPVITSYQKENTADLKKELEIGKPIPFSTAENHSFSEWLQLSAKKTIVREVEKQPQEVDEKEELINKFIENNPKISPLSKDKTIAIPIPKNKQDTSLMTITLAKVYLEQKKYDNAIQAYRILSLKYPEKSGYFADQIKKIQILQKNKL